MEFLNLGGNSEESVGAATSRSKKKVFAVVGITLIAATIGIGTTLASNITLNNNANVEFGQGVAQTVACETTEAGITVTPLSSFNNSGGYYNGSSYEGQFTLDRIGVSSIDTACQAVYFKISVYDSSTSNPLANFVVHHGSMGWAFDQPTNTGTPAINTFDVPTITNPDGSSFIAAAGTGTPIQSNQVYKITIESSVTEPSLSYNKDNVP
jgi:hypothetical protein